MYFAKNIVLVSSLLLSGCGEIDTFSTGVTIQGAGTGTGTVPPLPTDQEDNIEKERYIVWSQGSIESSCGNVKLTMQLLHNQTAQVLDRGAAASVLATTAENPTNVFFAITVENLSQYPAYEHFSSCRPNMQLQDENGIELNPPQDFSCPNDMLINPLQGSERKTYIYKFAVPLKVLQRKVIYRPDFSFNEIVSEEQRIMCEPLIYPIQIELN